MSRRDYILTYIEAAVRAILGARAQCHAGYLAEAAATFDAEARKLAGITPAQALGLSVPTLLALLGDSDPRRALLFARLLGEYATLARLQGRTAAAQTAASVGRALYAAGAARVDNVDELMGLPTA